MHSDRSIDTLYIRSLGLHDYNATWEAMTGANARRGDDTPDELWLVEHPPVYTLGLNGDRRHLLRANDIPVVATDRGGQITYHGPGQLVAYVLIDLRRRGLGVRNLVNSLENAVSDLLRQYGINGETRRDAPGVYVEGRKIASLGLRVRRGCSYHGLSFNVNLDLRPFAAINPCGYAGLEVTSLLELGIEARPCDLAAPLAVALRSRLGYAGISGAAEPLVPDGPSIGAISLLPPERLNV